VVRTRVGYAGGKKANPTYQDMGDHTEAIQIDFDPAVISYDELLDVFWQEHSGTGRAWSTQYAAFVFALDADQEAQARASRRTRADAIGREITTQVRRIKHFWRAEDYHQKFRLRHRSALTHQLIAHYGSDRAFVDSTAAARLNGLLGGNGKHASVADELERLTLPASIVAAVPN